MIFNVSSFCVSAHADFPESNLQTSPTFLPVNDAMMVILLWGSDSFS